MDPVPILGGAEDRALDGGGGINSDVVDVIVAGVVMLLSVLATDFHNLSISTTSSIFNMAVYLFSQVVM